MGVLLVAAGVAWLSGLIGGGIMGLYPGGGVLRSISSGMTLLLELLLVVGRTFGVLWLETFMTGVLCSEMVVKFGGGVLNTIGTFTLGDGVDTVDLDELPFWLFGGWIGLTLSCWRRARRRSRLEPGRAPCGHIPLWPRFELQRKLLPCTLGCGWMLPLG